MDSHNAIRGMVAYDFNQSFEDISYNNMEFKSFNVREVYIDGKQKGEYHIKINGSKSPTSAIIFLRPYFPQCSIDLIDSSGLLNLEYPIYLICRGNLMVMESIPQIFEKIEEDINASIS